MNLSDLSSGPASAKGWLSINAGSINSISSIFGQLVSVQDISVASVTQVNGAGPFTLTAGQTISGLFAYYMVGGPGAVNLNLPSAADITTALGLNIGSPVSFTFYVTTRGGTQVIVTPGANCTLFTTQPAFTVATDSRLFKLIYYGTGSSYVIYY